MEYESACRILRTYTVQRHADIRTAIVTVLRDGRDPLGAMSERARILSSLGY